MVKKIFISIFIIVSSFVISGCNTTGRALYEARDSIAELEQLNAEWAERNYELETLYSAERAGNSELTRIIEDQQSKLDGYIESERNRLEEEKLIVERFSGIFGDGTDIIGELIKGYNSIREIVIQDEITD